jgi:hypothetical protein
MITMIYKCVVVLQNCMKLVKVVPSSHSETCDDENQNVSIRDEDFKEIDVDEGPVQITFSPIKAEHEVCPCIFISLLASEFRRVPSIMPPYDYILFLISCGVPISASLYCSNREYYINYSVNLKMYTAYVTAVTILSFVQRFQ